MFKKAALASVLTFALTACSSDEPTPLGSSLIDDILGSRPGVVFQDTIGVFADTTISFNSMIAGEATLTLGLSQGYRHAMILQPDFTGASLDADKTVSEASLRILSNSIAGAFPVRFYLQPNAYVEGDSAAGIDTTQAIVDPETGEIDRTMQVFPANYPLPVDRVQGWIRGDSARTAVAIVYTDLANQRTALFNASEAVDDRPTLQVNFADGTSSSYKVNNDATFTRATNPPSQLLVGDGHLRRVHFRIDLDALSDSAAVHAARIAFHIVPGTLLGLNTTVVGYVPDSDDITSAGFLTGAIVSRREIDGGTEVLELPITNVVVPILEGEAPNTGFVIRFQTENTELRQIELYGSGAADSLRPRAFFTSSTPAGFDQ